MQTGRLRQRVTIQAEQPARDTVGAENVTWVDVATVWAEVKAAPTGSTEAFRSNADQWQAQSFFQVKIRWRDGMSIKHRLILEGRELMIMDLVDPDGRKREWRMVVNEVIA